MWETLGASVSITGSYHSGIAHSGVETSLKAVCLSTGSKESVFYGSELSFSIQGSEVFVSALSLVSSSYGSSCKESESASSNDGVGA
jgi:hypothetical protein